MPISAPTGEKKKGEKKGKVDMREVDSHQKKNKRRRKEGVHIRHALKIVDYALGDHGMRFGKRKKREGEVPPTGIHEASGGKGKGGEKKKPAGPPSAM